MSRKERETFLTHGCELLSQSRQKHCSEFGTEDTLCAFFRVHECICRRVASRGSSRLVELNNCFAELCVDVYRRYREGRVTALTFWWSFALQGYEEDRQGIARHLPLMAVAHILEDLPIAIYECCEVSKTEYYAVFSDIMICVEEIRQTYAIDENLKAEMLRHFRRNAPIPDKALRLVFFFALLFAWFPPILAIGIRKMRDVAWDNAQARKALAGTPASHRER